MERDVSGIIVVVMFCVLIFGKEIDKLVGILRNFNGLFDVNFKVEEFEVGFGLLVFKR